MGARNKVDRKLHYKIAYGAIHNLSHTLIDPLKNKTQVQADDYVIVVVVQTITPFLVTVHEVALWTSPTEGGYPCK